MNINFVFKEHITEKEYWEAEKELISHFEIEHDREQIQDDFESYDDFMKNECEQEIIIKDSDKIIGSFYCLITSKKLMYDFLSGKINENELLLKSIENKSYEAIYLCSTIIKKEYRKKRLTYKSNVLLIQSVIEKFQMKSPYVFYWPFSEKGKNCAKKITGDLNLELLERKERIQPLDTP